MTTRAELLRDLELIGQSLSPQDVLMLPGGASIVLRTTTMTGMQILEWLRDHHADLSDAFRQMAEAQSRVAELEESNKNLIDAMRVSAPVHKRILERAEKAEAECAALRKDGQRYAYIKTMEGQVLAMQVFRTKGGSHLDSEVDAAIARESGNGQ